MDRHSFVYVVLVLHVGCLRVDVVVLFQLVSRSSKRRAKREEMEVNGKARPMYSVRGLSRRFYMRCHTCLK